MSHEPVGIGVVGLGSRGRYFAATWNRPPGSRVVACCDREPGVLRSAREKIADESIAWNEDLAGMLRDPRVEAVVVATHERNHAECAIPVLRAGRHLRMERDTPLNNLFLSLLDRVGAGTEQLGDSTGRLTVIDS